MWHHLDPGAVQAEYLRNVPRRVLRNRDHDVRPQNGARHHKASAQRLAPRKPAWVPVDGQVVDGDDRRAPDAPQRQRAGWTEVGVGMKAPDLSRPLDVASDQAHSGQQAVHGIRNVDEASRWTEYGEPAVRAIDRHRVQDLSRINPDAGARPLEPRPIDDHAEARQKISSPVMGRGRAVTAPLAGKVALPHAVGKYRRLRRGWGWAGRDERIASTETRLVPFQRFEGLEREARTTHDDGLRLVRHNGRNSRVH